eukprot:COSAG02_NODE_24_length_52386_cov_726.042898_37_plen_197_part_00
MYITHLSIDDNRDCHEVKLRRIDRESPHLHRYPVQNENVAILEFLARLVQHTLTVDISTALDSAGGCPTVTPCDTQTTSAATTCLFVRYERQFVTAARRLSDSVLLCSYYLNLALEEPSTLASRPFGMGCFLTPGGSIIRASTVAFTQCCSSRSTVTQLALLYRRVLVCTETASGKPVHKQPKHTVASAPHDRQNQ